MNPLYGPLSQSPSTPPLSDLPPLPPETTLVGRGFWPRTAAYLIDLGVLVTSSWIAGAGVGAVVGVGYALLERPWDVTAQQLEAFTIPLSYLALFAYFIIPTWLGGATVGKLLFGLRVVAFDGQPCGLDAAIVRSLLIFVDSLFFGIPARLSMRQPHNQRLGDRAARTLVVSANTPGLINPRSRWGVLAGFVLWLVGYALCLSAIMLMLMMRGR
jgi:uncharacterized RDD family membrane protein YckC